MIFQSAELAHRPKGLRNTSALCKNPAKRSAGGPAQAGGVLTSQALLAILGPAPITAPPMS